MNISQQKDAVVAIIQKGDKFLFVKRSNYREAAAGYWCPVSGRVEKGESQELALQREVMEEVGLNVLAAKKICDIPTHDNSYLLHFWTTNIISGEASITSDEATDLRWVTIKQMKSLHPVFQEDIDIIERFADTQL
ncbi:MAG: NUDIX hydrolase [Proteobacteria bacterium]|nr:NUDIX hydrolase [Pseudomonadota bacterium]